MHEARVSGATHARPATAPELRAELVAALRDSRGLMGEMRGLIADVRAELARERRP